MFELKNIITNISIDTAMPIIIALAVIIITFLLSSSISKLIIKIIMPKDKHKKVEARKNPLYRQLKTIIKFLGVYVAFIISKNILNLGTEIENIVTKTFKIFMILMVAKAFDAGLDEKNMWLRKLHSKANKDADETTTKLLIRLIKVIVYIVAIFISISELGYDISGFITGLGITGVVITLAAQDTAKSLIGGIAIFLDKPFKVGDYIKIDDKEGTVEDIKFRSTSIRTPENSVLHIPNSKMSEAAILNYSEMEKRRYTANIELELNTPLYKVEAVKQKIEKALRKLEIVIPGSEVVRFEKISDNGISLIVIVYVTQTTYIDFLGAKEQINYQIMQVLENEKVELAYNTQTIYVKN
ncbi:MAG: mechanosensitive ion channel family protein [Clostridia bacterium]|nr:mechanosensitive ion channel family protein [Clostridia bacterium]